MYSRLAFTIIAFFIFNHSRAQNIMIKDLYGEWHVTKWIWFTNSEHSLTAEENRERKSELKKCLAAHVNFNDKGIHFSGGACQSELITSCGTGFLSTATINKIRVDSDKNDTLDIIGNPLFEDDIVGRKFARLIDRNFDGESLTVVETNCKSDWGSETYKVCVPNKFTIGIFSGADLLVLKRGTRKK
jgi:hypothetical protein